jgi:outer membrane protein OmpA-like peptidoglycan-associated protein
MATNLLELVRGAIPPEFADMAGSLIGESGATTASALGSVVPALIAGIAQKGASPAGAQSVMAALDNPAVDTSMLANLGGLFGSGGARASSIMASGAGVVSSLFGDKAGALTGALASMSGMRSPQSAGNLVALVTPIVLAVIKRFLGTAGGGASGLSALLAGQAPFLQGALDSRLTGALGFSSPAAMLSGLAEKAAGVTDAASQAAQRTGAAVTGAASAAAGAAGAASATAGTWIGRWWPWIVAAIIILFLLARCMGREEPAAPSAPPAAPPAAMAPAPAPAAATPASMPTSLPAKVYFDVGKTTLSDDGKSAVKAIADLVKKDGGKVDVTGYADASGDPAQNQEIAKSRAMAVRDELQADGVDAGAINMKPPASITGSGGDAEARRVEVSKAS